MPENRRPVLVLAPHPDDETFGCGGTLRMLTESGVSVDVLFLTRGEQGFESSGAATMSASLELAEVRSREARAACAVLGVREVYFLNGRDTRLNEDSALAEEIAARLKVGGYHRVFCPWAGDAHEDHQATFALLQKAIAKDPVERSYWLYEVWKPLPANTFVPIDHTMPAKKQAVEQYQSQLAVLNYREAFLGLAAYRSLFCPASTYAEAFLVCDGRAVINMN